MNEDETRKQAEEDAKEDLELKEEDAGKVDGGVRKAGKDQQEYVPIVSPPTV
jgi:hypothetical protein